MSSDPGTDGEGVGASTGGEGGAGGDDATPSPLTCAWELEAHERAADIVFLPQDLQSIDLVRLDDTHAHLVVHFDDNQLSEFSVFKLGGETATMSVQSSDIGSVGSVFSVRSDLSAVFYTQPADGNMSVLEIDAAEPPGLKVLPVAPRRDIEDIAPAGQADLHVIGAPVPGATPWAVDLFTTYATPNGGYQVGYGRHVGGSFGLEFAAVLDQPAPPEGLALGFAFHPGSALDGVIGLGSSTGPQLVTAGPGTRLPLAPVSLGQPEATVEAVARSGDRVNVAALRTTSPLEFVVASSPQADFASTFASPDSFRLVATYDSIEDRPAPVALPRWIGDTLVRIGTPDRQSDPIAPLSYQIVSASGVERAQGTLPFTAPLDETERRTATRRAVAVAPVGTSLEEGGALHVAWVESLVIQTGPPRSVVYYDRLRCTPQ
ncbi:MAG: hypothetical protein AAGA56_22770 [Myxococcota bacterium]